jgi:hypothetical protein
MYTHVNKYEDEKKEESVFPYIAVSHCPLGPLLKKENPVPNDGF